MQTKLIKVQDEYWLTTDKQTEFCYHLEHKEILKVKGVGEKSGEVHHDKGWNKPHEVVFIDTELSAKLSLKNCQAIDKGYDVDDLAIKFAEEESYGKLSGDLWKGFIYGFEKCLKIMGEKQFTRDNMLLLAGYVTGMSLKSDAPITELKQKAIEFIDRILQNVWNVEIECLIDGHEDVGTNTGIPKFDEEGYLILRRVV